MARRSAPAGGGPSQRQLRVGEQMRHVLADLLMRGGLREPALADAQLTVSEVRISADLRHAVVFVTELGGELGSERLEALAAGIPTACSNIEPVSGIAEDAALKFDPEDTGAIAACPRRASLSTRCMHTRPTVTSRASSSGSPRATPWLSSPMQVPPP